MLTFLLVYFPSFHNPYPKHIDEYHHLTEAIKLKQGESTQGISRMELGFHILIALLHTIFGSNLILIYRFLAPLFACLSSLALFFLAYKKSDNNFLIGIFAMIFFASIKSNVNITGLWFFTPLTFAIPFIFLYLYFFTEGIEKQNKKYILISLAIIILLLTTHALSVLFALPFLLIYLIINYKQVKKQWRFLLILLLIPLLGILAYKLIMNVPFSGITDRLIHALQFRKGWGILELNIHLPLLYSFIGFILAILGIISIFLFLPKSKIKKYSLFVVWPITIFISIFIYQKTNISYLVPYQRNVYYLILAMPFLSAMGLNYVIKFIEQYASKLKNRSFSKIITIIILAVIFFFTFASYYKIPEQIRLYTVMDHQDYESLLFLKDKEKSTVMADPMISEALFPVAQQNPVATLAFYGNRKDSEKFFGAQNCETRQELIDKYNAKYVLSKKPIDCRWDLIYNKGNYIYQTS